MVLEQDSSPEYTVPDWQEARQITGICARIQKVLNLPFINGIRRADRDNAIDLYIGEDYMDVLADGRWEKILRRKPEVFTREEREHG